MKNTSWIQTAALYTLVLVIVAVVTSGAMLLRDVLTLANFTMIYLLLVLVVAIRIGTVFAFVTAGICFICINYFLMTPIYALGFVDPLEVIDFTIFVIVAIIAGKLSAEARQQASEARQRAHEQEILYRLTGAFNQLTRKEGVHEALTRALRDDLGIMQTHILPGDSELPGDLVLQGSERRYGLVRVVGDAALAPSQRKLIDTCVSQAAMALERIDLSERAIKSQQFEEADKLKTAILHAVSHDLRTPITIIKSSASNLRRFYDQLTPQEEMEIAATIEHETDQLDKLVGNLLDLSRLQAGAMSLNQGANVLEEIVSDVVAQVWQRTKQERIKIIFPDDMPLVHFDYGLVRQALSNIVDNALRYEPAKQQIEIRGELRHNEAIIQVINHGETLPDDLKAPIMEPFYHGREGHTGLGLPIAKGIIEAHDGRLWVENTPGGGATFVFALPLNEEHQHDPQGSRGG